MFATDLLRALAIDALAVAGAVLVLAIPRRRLLAGVLAAWWCVPAVAVAWGWSRWALPLEGNAALHAALAALRLVPLAAGLAALLPAPPLDAAGLHLLRLAGVPAWRRQAAWLAHGAPRRWLLVAAALLPPAFAEFELASRLAVPAWAVRLFDAQAGGFDPARTLAIALPGMAVQAAALAVAWALAWRGAGGAPAPAPRRAPAGWALLAAGTLALVAVPLGLIAAEAGAGSLDALVDGGLWRECAATAGYAAAAAAIAWLAAGLLPRAWAVGAAAPGLAGSLALGLAALALAGQPGWSWLTRSPAALLAVLALAALPWAVLLRRAAGLAAASAAHHAAGLLRAGDGGQRRAGARLEFRLGGALRWGAWGVLFAACAGDLAAGAMLAPVETPVLLPRLYHFMHYGRTPQLAALVLAAVALPLAGAGLLLAARAAHARWSHG